jgi:nitrite reductase/ring-hydroxylating ferredoxin subunit/uncharacterized membrane protein
VKNLPPFTAVDRVENARFLDAPAGAVQRLVHRVLPRGSVKDFLHGVPQGHPLHPAVVQLPVGAWTSAAILDLFPGTGRAATILVGAGLASVVPAAASGLTDFSDLHSQQARVAVVHAGINVLGSAAFAASLLARLCGRHGAGRRWARVGILLAGAGASLGGHLSFRQSSGANHTESVPHRVAPGWHPLGGLDEFTPGRMVRRMLGEVPVLVWRPDAGTEVYAIADTCSHLSGPLHEGEVAGEAGRECVVCPWHKSTFLLRTGEVVHGPATVPQPRFRTRVTGSLVQICLEGAG